MSASQNEKHGGRLGSLRRLKPILYTFYVLVIANAAIEITLRKFDPTGLNSYFTGVRLYFSNVVKNRDYAYINKANFKGNLSGAEVMINDHGLRSPEVRLTKDDDTYRVMIVGDSVVFGWGVQQDSIFSIRMEKMLNETDRRHEVIAAGVGSWNTRTEYEYFKNSGIEFGPDVVILVIVSNDLEPKTEGRTDVSRDRLFAYTENTGTPARELGDFARELRTSKSKLLQHVKYVLTRRKINKATRLFDDQSPQWEDAHLALEKMINLCNDNGIAFVACIYGYDDMVASPPLSYYNSYLTSRGVPVVTLPKSLFTDRRYHNSIVDRHPNAAGHELIAETLYAAVLPIMEKIWNR